MNETSLKIEELVKYASLDQKDRRNRLENYFVNGVFDNMLCYNIISCVIYI